jgi:DNA-binding XRE family transcriptional regulator
MIMELTLGEKIRLLREERELNQTELGQAVNMTQRKISYLERDQYEPSLEDIRLLCKFLSTQQKDI